MRVMVLVKATKNSEAGILPGDPRAPKRAYFALSRRNQTIAHLMARTQNGGPAGGHK